MPIDRGKCVACDKPIPRIPFDGLFGFYCDEKCWFNVEGAIDKK